MSNEELERMMQFRLNNQAKFDANMQEIEAKQKKTGENLDRLIVQHSAIEDVMMTLAKSHVMLVQSHKELADSHRQLTDVQKRLTEA